MVPLNQKQGWPTSRSGIRLGRDSYLLLSIDNGQTFYEAETARDISFDISWSNADVTMRASGAEHESRPIHRSFTASAEILFDSNEEFLEQLIYYSLGGDSIVVGAFSDSGLGPLFWGFVDVSISNELEGVVKVSAKFTCELLCRFYLSTAETSHPIHRIVEAQVRT